MLVSDGILVPIAEPTHAVSRPRIFTVQVKLEGLFIQVEQVGIEGVDRLAGEILPRRRLQLPDMKLRVPLGLRVRDELSDRWLRDQ